MRNRDDLLKDVTARLKAGKYPHRIDCWHLVALAKLAPPPAPEYGTLEHYKNVEDLTRMQMGTAAKHLIAFGVVHHFRRGHPLLQERVRRIWCLYWRLRRVEGRIKDLELRKEGAKVLDELLEEENQ